MGIQRAAHRGAATRPGCPTSNLGGFAFPFWPSRHRKSLMSQSEQSFNENFAFPGQRKPMEWPASDFLGSLIGLFWFSGEIRPKDGTDNVRRRVAAMSLIVARCDEKEKATCDESQVALSEGGGKGRRLPSGRHK